MKTDSSRATPVDAFNFDGDYGTKYATLARQVIPAYEQTFQLAFAALDQSVGAKGRMLVAGCGTGIELVTLGSLAPGWEFVGVDPSKNMLGLARQAVADSGMSNRVEFRHGFVSEVQDAEFDAATLFNVLHFLEDDGEKETLLGDLKRRLKPNGRLVMLDLHGDPTSQRFVDTMDRWERFMTVRGLVGEEQKIFRQRIDDGIRWVDGARIEALLGAAGFENVERYFHALFYGGWMGDA
jgi:tRNA (cmo5U34)-methyltransferase